MSNGGPPREAPPVFLRHLSLRSFRNYGSLELDLTGGLILVVGPNGQGKTNLVEAVYILCLGRSFRERREQRLIRLGDDRAVLAGEFGAGERRQGIAVDLERTGKKTVRLNGTRLERLSDLVGRFPVVGLTPDESGIVGGDPAARRRFTDLVLAQTRPAYLEALRIYRGALIRRNRCLRQRQRPLAVTYDPVLVRSAAAIRKGRAGLVSYLSEHAPGLYAEISGEAEVFGITYRPSPAGEPDDDGRLAGELERTLDRDAERGYTGSGPHRDEFVLTVDGRELRTFGSHGQARTALAALKLAEVRYYTALYQRRPLLVMDEVAAVLDSGRALNLVAMVTEQVAQVFMTTPRRDVPAGLSAFAGQTVAVSEGAARSVAGGTP